MKNVIITCSNHKIGNFLINHWLRSLKENVNLKDTDIVVIDYGLNDKQKKILNDEGVILHKGVKNYHIVNKRFFDAKKILKKNNYKQVLFIDGGDIIFQSDISDVFNKNKNSIRATIIGVEVLFFEWFISVFGNFTEETKIEIWKTLWNKPVINAGVIFAPSRKFIEMCSEMERMINNKNSFGPDQIIVNYYLYKYGFVMLDEKYNFMINAAKKGFNAKNGVIYKKNGEKAAIVHNAGQLDIFRPIDNFGYGPKHNKVKQFIYHAKRTQYKILEIYKKVFPKKNNFEKNSQNTIKPQNTIW